MEKMMKMVACSELRSVNTKDREGRDQVIESFDVVLTDGIDTILAETSKSTTIQFKNAAPQIGAFYGCSIKLNVIEYEKEGKKSRFFKASLMDCKPL